MESGIGLNSTVPGRRPSNVARNAVSRPGETSATTASAEWTTETVLSVRAWTSGLFSFRTSRYREFRFIPGQFARIGLPSDDDAIVWRPYSIVSAARDEHLEFFFTTLPESAFTRRLARLRPGDRLLVEKRSYGDLTTDRFVGGKKLWMLSGGTGLAPFLSILRDAAVWERFDHLILVHSARQGRELAYRDEITDLARNQTLSGVRTQLCYIPVATRECRADALCGRITRLIADGRLEARAGLPFDRKASRIMVCGGMEMARDLRQLLVGRGFRVSRRGDPGQLAFESY